MSYSATVAVFLVPVNLFAVVALLFARKCRWNVARIAMIQVLLNLGFALGNEMTGGPTVGTKIACVLGLIYGLIAIVDSYRTYVPPSR